MATATFSTVPTNATDAEFRAWGGGLSTALAAVGLVKTTDTGQINWATVTRPLTVSTFQGYEVWRFNDALQSTAPLFLKIEYGAAAGSASRPALRVALGKASDGAGTLSGLFGASPYTISSGSIGVTPATSYISSGGGSMLAIALWPTSSATVPLNLILDRSRDAAGAATGWAVVFIPTNTTFGTYVYSTAGTAVQSGPYPNPQIVALPSTTVAGVAPMYPLLCIDGQGHYWQSRAALLYNVNDAALAVPVTVAGWGTFLPTWTSLAGTGTNAAIAWS